MRNIPTRGVEGLSWRRVISAVIRTAQIWVLRPALTLALLRHFPKGGRLLQPHPLIFYIKRPIPL